MTTYKKIGTLQVEEGLYHFLQEEVLIDFDLNQNKFWNDFSCLVSELTPENEELLKKRKQLQTAINDWHVANPTFNQKQYKQFLEAIGYLEKEPETVNITTDNVDDEITIAGPQLVVPVNNARYAINAANARWGSLYDALYGTDVIPETDGAEKGSSYNPKRGEKVVAFGRSLLDQFLPLVKGSHHNVNGYFIGEGGLVFTLEDGRSTTLEELSLFRGFRGEKDNPTSILFRHHGLHIELVRDKKDPIGSQDKAYVKDIIFEAALTTIIDCEDSVAAVDAEDKLDVYRNWLGLMKGNLTASFKKNGSMFKRCLQGDREYTGLNDDRFTLRGRSLLFIRNVGHLMTTDAILDEAGNPLFEGILDTVVTSLISLHSLKGRGKYVNSKTGSIYIVKPKMHGPKEVAFSNTLFNRVEDLLGLKRHTIKIGVMDEERRTSLNLKACMEQVKERIVFVNTGFLDRTGDEIHTSMLVGPVQRKNDMKHTEWIQAYEASNVSAALSSGFQKTAQIGKGMWAAPERMKAMLEEKVLHPQAGATTAWVPSPTAATLHALHYHQVDVHKIQQQLSKNEVSSYRDRLLKIPIMKNTSITEEDIEQELNNNVQGILGYVVRWVNHGIGCSKVPDIHNIGLMEDRATLRISSQHIANWLHHGVCTKGQVYDAFKNMAKVVDQQNQLDAFYEPMANNEVNSIAFQTACKLVFEGKKQSNGYTEPILHEGRRAKKAENM
ncbi:malate synthase G [Oceanobacillus manasiensis]|uniref:malate synthase G n=1 Tax=Oceanobacillus manasiensis TaxID=586413 RepID=UPI0005A6CBC9|nr:malate synthase G [Oceanobacillus manasiensis]